MNLIEGTDFQALLIKVLSDARVSDLFSSVFSAFHGDMRACPRVISALMPK